MAELKAHLDEYALKKLDDINKLRKETLTKHRQDLRGVSRLSPAQISKVSRALRTRTTDQALQVLRHERGEPLLLSPVKINRGELISRILQFVIATENTSPLIDWLCAGDKAEAQGKQRKLPAVKHKAPN